MPCQDCPEEPKSEEVVAIGWSVWYADRKLYTSRDNKWEKLPNDGVIAVIVFFNKGKRIMTGSDFYFRAPGNDDKFIYAQSSPGDSKKEIEKRYPKAIVLRGKWTDDTTMHALDRILIDSSLD